MFAVLSVFSILVRSECQFTQVDENDIFSLCYDIPVIAKFYFDWSAFISKLNSYKFTTIFHTIDHFGANPDVAAMVYDVPLKIPKYINFKVLHTFRHYFANVFPPKKNPLSCICQSIAMRMYIYLLFMERNDGRRGRIEILAQV